MGNFIIVGMHGSVKLVLWLSRNKAEKQVHKAMIASKGESNGAFKHEIMCVL